MYQNGIEYFYVGKGSIRYSALFTQNDDVDTVLYFFSFLIELPQMIIMLKHIFNSPFSPLAETVLNVRMVIKITYLI